MTTDEIKTVLANHILWLAGESSGQKADLAGADLTRANLAGANLTRAEIWPGWTLIKKENPQ